MLLGLIRDISGWVSFTIAGRFQERFINIASRNGIRLWDVNRNADTITASMYMSDYMRIRPLARASGVRLRINEKHGLPCAARVYNDRIGLFVGAFVFVLTVFIMSGFIWSIDVTGLDTVSESELRALLSEHGLYVGSFKPTLDYQGVSRAVMLDNRRIGWMAVNVTGSVASVEIKEESPTPDVDDIGEPCNVKAERDGTIRCINARQGSTVVKEGSGVIAGQLIVSGVMEDADSAARLVRADAEIIADTVHEAQFTVSEDYSLIMPSGERGERKTIDLFGLRIPISAYSTASDNSAVNTVKECPKPLDTVLPIGLITQKVEGMSEKRIHLSDDSAKELLLDRSMLFEVFSLSDCKVGSKQVKLDHTDGGYTMNVRYNCVEDIAYQEPIGTDEGTDQTKPDTDRKNE